MQTSAFNSLSSKEFESIAALAHASRPLAEMCGPLADCDTMARYAAQMKCMGVFAAKAPALATALTGKLSISTYAQEMALAEEARAREAADRLMGRLSSSTYAQEMALAEEARAREAADRFMGNLSAVEHPWMADSLAAQTALMRAQLSDSTSPLALLNDSTSAFAAQYEKILSEQSAADVLRLAKRDLDFPPVIYYDAPRLPPSGPTFVEVFDKKDARDDERHRERMAFAKQVAEENDRRSAENDRREARNNKREALMLRVAIIFGMAGVIAAVWMTIITNLFGS